jgi:hypothetical protein
MFALVKTCLTLIRTTSSALLVLLVTPSTAAQGTPQCAYDWAVDISLHRGARPQQNRADHAGSGEICRIYIKHFVEAVTARKDAASCQDAVERRRALETLDAEIQAFNDRIAENSCQP